MEQGNIKHNWNYVIIFKNNLQRKKSEEENEDIEDKK